MFGRFSNLSARNLQPLQNASPEWDSGSSVHRLPKTFTWKRFVKKNKRIIYVNTLSMQLNKMSKYIYISKMIKKHLISTLKDWKRSKLLEHTHIDSLNHKPIVYTYLLWWHQRSAKEISLAHSKYKNIRKRPTTATPSI